MSENMEGVSPEQLDRNKEFLTRMIDAYSSCAMLAMEGDLVVAHARFYPQVIVNPPAFLCCQDPQYAITQEMVEMDLPAIEDAAGRTLRIHCFLVHNDYRGRGLSHALLEGILEWARSHGWKAVRAYAGADNYWLASQLCAPMLRTYAKHGFEKTKTVSFPEATDLLRRIQEGELGVEKKAEFDNFCRGRDLSQLALLYEVECQL
jgi:GNAT superfamily N-acetyltransferase